MPAHKYSQITQQIEAIEAKSSNSLLRRYDGQPTQTIRKNQPTNV